MAELGYIRDKIDIKFLVLFVLSTLDTPVSLDDLAELVMVEQTLSYFDVADAIYEMAESGHVTLDDQAQYTISDKGRAVMPGYELRLPVSVRRDAQKAVMRMIARLKRDTMIRTETTVGDDGKPVTELTMCDDSGEILRLRMLMANPRIAAIIEANFKSHAERIYNELLNALMRDYFAEDAARTPDGEKPAAL